MKITLDIDKNMTGEELLEAVKAAAIKQSILDEIREETEAKKAAAKEEQKKPDPYAEIAEKYRRA